MEWHEACDRFKKVTKNCFLMLGSINFTGGGFRFIVFQDFDDFIMPTTFEFRPDIPCFGVLVCLVINKH